MIFVTPLLAAILLVLTYKAGFSRRMAYLDLFCLLGLTALSQEAPLLGLTLAIEAIVVFLLAKALSLPVAKLVLASLLINTLTQPLFFLFSVSDHGAAWILNQIVGEAAVFGIEATLYVWILGNQASGSTIRKALLISFLANLASGAVGLALPL